MAAIITANTILWLSIFTYFFPQAIDQEIKNQDNLVSIHKIENDQ